MIWVTKAITLCRETENVHFCRDADFPEKHMQGIISHAGYNISPGMVEGFNNKIRIRSYNLNLSYYNSKAFLQEVFPFFFLQECLDFLKPPY